jgi:hypothetical protein
MMLASNMASNAVTRITPSVRVEPVETYLIQYAKDNKWASTSSARTDSCKVQRIVCAISMGIFKHFCLKTRINAAQIH